MAVKEEEVDVGMWRKVVVGASERRLMEAMAGVGVERPCAAGRQREEACSDGGDGRRRMRTSGCRDTRAEVKRTHMSA
jgi:hypothetical protein